MTERAKIIFIHGASSSGKSTLARAIQTQISEPFWHVSIDHIRDSGMLPMEGSGVETFIGESTAVASSKGSTDLWLPTHRLATISYWNTSLRSLSGRLTWR
jgi:hypothetical protein